jgi:hypothetical protein
MKIHKTNQGETMVPYSHRMMALKWQVWEPVILLPWVQCKVVVTKKKIEFAAKPKVVIAHKRGMWAGTKLINSCPSLLIVLVHTQKKTFLFSRVCQHLNP